LTPRTKLLLALPLIAALVFVLAYFQLFASPILIVFILAVYVVVSFRNKKKFGKQRRQ
jgi:hypothetical protein